MSLLQPWTFYLTSLSLSIYALLRRILMVSRSFYISTVFIIMELESMDCIYNMILRYEPGLSRLQKVTFTASCKNFSMVRKFFCSLWISTIFIKTHFFMQHPTSKVFEKFMRSASKIFAWWEKISACCKNLHPWFCSLEKPHYGSKLSN